MSRLTPFIPTRLRRLYRKVFPHRPPDYARLWESACQKWIVGGTDLAADRLVINGWLIAPPDLRSSVGFRINGGKPDPTQFPLPRPDLAAQKGQFVPDPGPSGFLLWTDPGDRDLTITAVDERTGSPLGPDYLTVHIPSVGRLGPVPAGENVRRVIGESSAFNFAMGGYTAYRRLEEAIRSAGEDPASFQRVLDWGCGCARVSRYFPPTQVTGVDVDAGNVGWCRANLPGGSWRVVPLRPPTELPDAGFDLAFGVSVFTHLREAEQFAWLAELRRVVRPGGLALMTFHGNASIVWARLSAERYTTLRRDGICDQANPLYDADLAEADYYRDTFHTADYVRREWGRFFEVLDVRPSFISHQDLVVLRRPV